MHSPTVRVQQKPIISPDHSKRRTTKVESEYNYTNLIEGSLLEQSFEIKLSKYPEQTVNGSDSQKSMNRKKAGLNLT